MKHTSRHLSQRMDKTPCNEDDWIFQMPRKWFRKMMRYRRGQTRKVLGRARTEEIRRTYR